MNGKHHSQCNCIDCIAFVEEIATVDLDDWMPCENNVHQLPYTAPRTEDGRSHLYMQTNANGAVELPHQPIFSLGSRDSIVENRSSRRLIETCHGTPTTTFRSAVVAPAVVPQVKHKSPYVFDMQYSPTHIYTIL